jgi:hypothetical protein
MFGHHQAQWLGRGLGHKPFCISRRRARQSSTCPQHVVASSDSSCISTQRTLASRHSAREECNPSIPSTGHLFVTTANAALSDVRWSMTFETLDEGPTGDSCSFRMRLGFDCHGSPYETPRYLLAGTRADLCYRLSC